MQQLRGDGLNPPLTTFVFGRCAGCCSGVLSLVGAGGCLPRGQVAGVVVMAGLQCLSGLPLGSLCVQAAAGGAACGTAGAAPSGAWLLWEASVACDRVAVLVCRKAAVAVVWHCIVAFTSNSNARCHFIATTRHPALCSLMLSCAAGWATARPRTLSSVCSSGGWVGA